MERVLKTLESLGLTKGDAKLYVYLSKKGPLEEEVLLDSLKITKKKLDVQLKNLDKKGIIEVSREQPALFFAVAFERVLDLLVEVNLEQAKTLKQTKKNLLSSWRKINWENNSQDKH